ncbi:PREDICTED: mucin-5AC [Rhagoletis zephyria]|uniref:mucin-5AC n=1 Tax=Rhagoletis zephyria TaxID=28612 RepID=UPI0008116099|nr:PREDICTED: mucin-5AC [Rhagoletis zephyria]
MITDRNKFNFVTICIGLSLLLTNASVASTQATSNTQQETNQQQLEQAVQNQPAIAAISVAQNEDASTNAILNEPGNGVGTVHAFSPRLDYSNEWRPVGRGDPLKNDPTFDYSPPTLEHVRYWAETTKDSSKEESSNGKQEANSVRFAHPSKKDIMLLGMPNENVRASSGAHASKTPHQYENMGQHALPPHQHQQPFHQPYGGSMKNAKGETPLLQPKYTSVRRSYYAQQLPTRLMPPPMQANSPPLNTFNVPMKPSQAAQVHTEYRHGMSAMPPHVSNMPSMATVSHMKPAAQHHPSMSTPSSSTWMYSSPPAAMQHHHYAMSSGAGPFMSTASQPTRMPHVSHAYDSHPQDSHHYFSYTRPNPNSMAAHLSQEPHSPNSLRHSGNSHKQSGAGRKPWLHELLQKEVVKTSSKPSYSTAPNKFAYETTKPIYERMPSMNSLGSGFTPITPVTFVSGPPTIATAAATMTTTTTTTTRAPSPPSVAFTPSAFYPTTSTTTARPTTSSTTARAIYTTPTTAPTTPRTPSSTTTSRLLIPTTSNLAYRPTVAPMQMTTDSLFSHYKQPEAPLRGPMYLIIEGHSKVKKYGKNGINLNLPKIVPVIPKREPVVRIAEPGDEKRGTPETFQVEHLHVKTSTSMPTTTTTTARTVTTPKPATTAKPVPTTTAKPAPISKKVSTVLKSAMPANLTAATKSAKETTQKPTATSTTTTARPAATTVAPKAATTTSATAKATTELTMKAAAAKPTQNEPLIKLELPNDPPTGMQGLLSLLDSSLSGFFAEQEQPLHMPPAAAQLSETKQATSAQIYVTTPSTVLQPVNTTHSAVPPVNADARVGSNANRIMAAAAAAMDVDQSGSAEFSHTTDVPPREVRQVFDYDQRPESRLKDFVIESIGGEGDEGASAFYEDEEFEEYDDDAEDVGSQQPIKRIDKFVDFGGDEGEFVGDYENVALEELGLGDAVPVAKTAAASATA